MDKQIKFYRVPYLPETGEVGSVYFVSDGDNQGLWVCTDDDQYEQYGAVRASMIIGLEDLIKSYSVDTSEQENVNKAIAAALHELHNSLLEQEKVNKTIAAALHEVNNKEFNLFWENE